MPGAGNKELIYEAEGRAMANVISEIEIFAAKKISIAQRAHKLSAWAATGSKVLIRKQFDELTSSRTSCRR
jgi:cytochrome c556